MREDVLNGVVVNECFQSHLDKYRYIGVLDLDEVILPKKIDRIQTLEDSFTVMIKSSNFIDKSQLFDFSCSKYDRHFRNTSKQRLTPYSKNLLELFIDNLRTMS